MSDLLKGSAGAAALAALALAVHGCSTGPADLGLGTAGAGGAETAPNAADAAPERPQAEAEAAQGTAAGGQVQTLVEAAGDGPVRVVQVVEAGEDAAGAEVERLSLEQEDAQARGDTEAGEAIRTALEAAAAALRSAQEAVEAAQEAVEVAREAQRDAAREAGIAWAVELAANTGKWDYEAGHRVGSFSYHWEYALPGSSYASVSRSHRAGGKAGAVLARDASGELVFNTAMPRDQRGGAPLQRDPEVWAVRYINTYDGLRGRKGVSRDVRPVDGHGLGYSWQRYDLTQDYDGNGTLSVSVFTDVGESDLLPAPYGGNEFARTILLDGVGGLPADLDFMYVEVPADGLAGSLDGLDGRLSCAASAGGYCSLGRDTEGTARGFYPMYNDVVFTPDDDSEAVALAAEASEAFPHADYLSMGHWLFVPEDPSAFEAYDFGVFAGGSDPFHPARLEAVEGTALYTGAAAGLYHARLSPGSVHSGRFTASVALTAEFGTNAELGTLGGEVYGFELDAAAPFPPPSGLPLGTAEISSSVSSCSGNVPGGWVCGTIPAGADADGQWWWGEWSAKFFGNDAATADLPLSFVSPPTSVAGTFSAGSGNNVGFAGSFGAHWDEPVSTQPVVPPVNE